MLSDDGLNPSSSEGKVTARTSMYHLAGNLLFLLKALLTPYLKTPKVPPVAPSGPPKPSSSDSDSDDSSSSSSGNQRSTYIPIKENFSPYRKELLNGQLILLLQRIPALTRPLRSIGILAADDTEAMNWFVVGFCWLRTMCSETTQMWSNRPGYCKPCRRHRCSSRP